MKSLPNSSITVQDMKKIKIFKFLPDEALQLLINGSETIAYENNEVIIKEGEISHYFYAVMKGGVVVNVEKKKKNPDGHTYISTMGEGDIFGEAGLFQKVKRTANVVSYYDSHIIRFNRDFLFDFIKKQTNAGVTVLIMIIYSMLKKLREANQELAFERAEDISQNEIDSIIHTFMDDKK